MPDHDVARRWRVRPGGGIDACRWHITDPRGRWRATTSSHRDAMTTARTLAAADLQRTTRQIESIARALDGAPYCYLGTDRRTS